MEFSGDIRIKVGNRIRQLRKELLLSQESLAFKAGLDRTYIASVENGKRNLSIMSLYGTFSCSAPLVPDGANKKNSEYSGFNGAIVLIISSSLLLRENIPLCKSAFTDSGCCLRNTFHGELFIIVAPAADNPPRFAS